MRRSITIFFLLICACMFFGATASAQFSSGNLVVVQMGDGSAALSTSSAPIFLRQYTSSGALIQTIPISSTGASPRFTVTGNSGSEGHIVRSADSQYVTIAGYDTVAGVTGFAVATTKRIISRINASGVIDLTTEFNDGGTSAVRSAVAANSTATWTATSANGVRYKSFGSIDTSTQLSTSPTNTRVVKIFNGQLYATSASGAFLGVSSIGTGTPITRGQATTALAGMPTSGSHSPYSFSVSPDTNTIYIADDGAAASGGGIQKWTRSSGTWSLSYTLLNNGTVDSTVRGLAVDWSGTNPVIYATTGRTSANTLIKVTDAGSSSTATTLATAPANTVFRGVDFAPVGYTTPTVFLTGGALDFGSVAVGDSSSEKSFTVAAINLTQNLVITAPASYQISNISGSGYASTLNLTPTNGSVAATTIYIRFKPIQSGTISGNVTQTSVAATTQQFAVTGVGMQAGFTASKLSSNFGNVFKDSTKTDTVTVTNTSTTLSLVIDSVKVRSSNTYFTVTPTNSTIGASSAAKFVITFQPAAIGSAQASVVFYHNAPSHQDTIKVSGNGILKAPIFSVTPASLNLPGVLIGQSKNDSLMVKNVGYDSLIISNVISTDGVFTLTPTTARLDTGKSQKFYFTFTPTAPGRKAASIVFSSNVPETKDTVAIFGSGAAFVPISEARKDANNDFIADHSVTKDTLFIRGVITSTNLQSLGGSTSLFIQDSTAGIQIYTYGALPPVTMVIGDSVFAIGVVYQYKGAIEFEPLANDIAHFGVIKHNAIVPKPKHLTLHQFVANSESYEGLLVEIDSLYKASGTWPAANSYASIYVTNANKDTAQLYISSSTDLAGWKEPAYPINVVAIINQYGTTNTNGYEIEPSDTSNIIHTPGATGVANNKTGIPVAYELSQNYPNPFNPSTTISFGLPSQSHVIVKVYSILGQEVVTLMDGVQEAGYHNVVWNGRNGRSGQVASGVYLLRVIAQSTSSNATFVQVRKMLLLK